jgi:type IV secretion system protein VirB9
MKKCFFITVSAVLCLSLSCRTVQFDAAFDSGPEASDPGIHDYREELEADQKEQEQIFIEEELKEVDIEQTVIYIDRPVYTPVETPPTAPASGEKAVSQSTQQAIQVPLKYVNGMMFYPWDETFTYEIHCQPYRTTDIQLEPGEQVLEVPFLSEEKVWEIGAGVSRKNGQDVQHFFVKPTYSALTTSMIIITDRRVYHLLLKSFKDHWMVMVQWEYPDMMPYTLKTEAMNRRTAELSGDGLLVNPEFLSFDYKMTYSIFKKPVWLPKRVYDDGRKTYIELDEKMLHMESPVIFNHRNERINYRVQKNLVIIDELIEKITVRRGREKVTITKKRYKAPVTVSDTAAETVGDGAGE